MYAVVVALAASTFAATPTPAVARTRSIVIEGRGYGHGYGMGQWGARGMAERGASWRAILRHYYRGASIARLDPPERIRVLVARGGSVRIGGRALAVRARGRTIATPRWVRARSPGSGIVVERGPSRTGPWRAIAHRRVVVDARRGPTWVGTRAHPGSIRVVRSGGTVAAIAVLPLERYVAAVVPREMPAYWPRAALRAQAVAARTYAVRVRRATRGPYDICATAACQVYGGVRWRSVRMTHPRSSRAVRATAHRILTHRGEPILAQYSSSSGGWTDRGTHPALRPVRDRGDRGSPFHRWREREAAAHIERHWPAIGTFERVRVVRRNGYGAWGGRVRLVAVEGTRGRALVGGDRFATAMDLRSDWFRVAGARRPGSSRFGRTLSEGDQSDDVGRLQRRLRRAGFFPRRVAATGYFGPITERSVRRYQRARGIQPTGIVGPITRARLSGVRYRFRLDMGYGTTHPAVRELQRRLARAGSYPRAAPHTMFFGPITRDAVRRYQRAHDIPATGYVGPLTRRSLNRR